MNFNGVCLSKQRALSVSGSTESEDVRVASSYI